MDLIYKNDQKLLEKSIQSILSIDNVEAMKSLYKHFFIKSPYTIDTFQHIQKKCPNNRLISHEKINASSLLFCIKSPLIGKRKLCNRRDIKKQNTKYKIQDESYF